MAKRINVYHVELVRESAKTYDVPSSNIRSPQDARDIMCEVFNMENLPNEIFVMLALNTRNKVVGAHALFSGTVNQSVVHPRDVFQHALLNNATSVIVGHNHPSESTEPSNEDIKATKALCQAGKMIGIDVIDHIIIGANGEFTSLKQKHNM